MTNPVNAWDTRVLAVAETAFGTTPTPADVAALAAQALEFSIHYLDPDKGDKGSEDCMEQEKCAKIRKDNTRFIIP